MSVGRICTRDVDLAHRDESIQAAAERMHSHNVGTLVVLLPSGEPVGILTDRDVTVRVVAQGKDPYQTTVGEVMTACPRVVKEDTPIESALGLMRTGPFRRIPVVDAEGKLVGLLSLDDILDLLTEEFGYVRELLRRESPSSVAQL
jgi:CBS domain-containing protein